MAYSVSKERAERIEKVMKFFENKDLKPKPGEYLEGECIEFSTLSEEEMDALLKEERGETN